MASYTDPTKMALYLGVTFTADQTTLAQSSADAVTTWIDRRTGRTWQDVAASVADEIHQISNGVVFLDYPPVTALGDVEARLRGGSNPWELLAPEQYVLADPSTGRVEFVDLAGVWAASYDARVDYTSAVTAPPDDILLAATVLACYFMRSSLRPGTAGLSSLSLGQSDISVAFASAGDAMLSADVGMAIRVVDSYRMPVIA